MTQIQSRSLIAEMNDDFRRRLFRGDTKISSRIRQRGQAFEAMALAAVCSHDYFDEDSDPSGRHECGVVPVEGVAVSFQITYEAADQSTSIVDPSCRWASRRVLHITEFNPFRRYDVDDAKALDFGRDLAA